jgi:3D (Asp-Asp-Asp) domain-containing protein
MKRWIIGTLIYGVVLAIMYIWYLNIQDAIKEYNLRYECGDSVTVTVYTNSERETDNDPSTTASGYRINEERDAYNIVSVSRDLLELYPYGSIIKIEHEEINKLYGKYFIVLDTLNKRYINYVDILIKKGDPIDKWENVIIFKIE